MKFDERKATPILFSGEDPVLLKEFIEEGDEAVLFQDGKLIMVQISSRKRNKMVGTITWSTYDPDLHAELTTGKEIQFFLKNIFGIYKTANKN